MGICAVVPYNSVRTEVASCPLEPSVRRYWTVRTRQFMTGRRECAGQCLRAWKSNSTDSVGLVMRSDKSLQLVETCLIASSE